MNVKSLLLPLFLTGALLVGCDDRTASKPDASATAKAADAKAAADKTAADATAEAKKDAADAKAAADKAAANAKADADKAAANAKTDADKAAADAARNQASKRLADLQTAVTGQRWTEAGVLIKQMDGVRDNLAADQKATFDSLKKQYDDNKPKP